MSRHAFIVIVDVNDDGGHEPCIGDVHWALKDKFDENWRWKFHTTSLTVDMLKRHRLPPFDVLDVTP